MTVELLPPLTVDNYYQDRYIALCHILRNKLIFKLVVVIVFLIPILFVEGIQHLFRS